MTFRLTTIHKVIYVHCCWLLYDLHSTEMLSILEKSSIIKKSQWVGKIFMPCVESRNFKHLIKVSQYIVFGECFACPNSTIALGECFACPDSTIAFSECFVCPNSAIAFGECFTCPNSTTVFGECFACPSSTIAPQESVGSLSNWTFNDL